MGAKNVQELIELLQEIKDKTQPIHVWDRYGYYGSDLAVLVDTEQAEKPLIIISE